jgi:hypothetical protein
MEWQEILAAIIIAIVTAAVGFFFGLKKQEKQHQHEIGTLSQARQVEAKQKLIEAYSEFIESLESVNATHGRYKRSLRGTADELAFAKNQFETAVHDLRTSSGRVSVLEFDDEAGRLRSVHREEIVSSSVGIANVLSYDNLDLGGDNGAAIHYAKCWDVLCKRKPAIEESLRSL